MSFARVELSVDKIKEILQHINDRAHEAINNGEIIVLAKHDRKDPRRFEIIADSIYDQQLEGIKVLFENKDEFKQIFPMFANPAPVYNPPNTEPNAQGKPVARHIDPYMPIGTSARDLILEMSMMAIQIQSGQLTSWELNTIQTWGV